MAEPRPGRHYFFIALFGACLLALAFHIGFKAHQLWVTPIVLALFFFAYWFDVRLPGSTSRMTVDYAIALPATVLLGNPLLPGLLAGAGLLLNRAVIRRVLRPVNFFDALNGALSFTLAGMLLQWLTADLPVRSPLWGVYLLISMATFTLVDLAGYLLDRLSVGVSVSPKWVGRYLLQMGIWLPLSLPFMTLVVLEILDEKPLEAALASIPVLVIVWALHLNANLEEKNSALILANRRQEFLQQLTMTTTGSLESEGFLRDLLQGLKEFVPWDRELLLILPALEVEEPFLFSLGALPEDPHAAKETLTGFLDEASKFKRRIASAPSLEPLLDRGSVSQVVVALATSEVAFGVLVLERTGPTPFQESDGIFLEMAFAQIASQVQDEILKKQLLATNRRLMHQADYLSQILHISNLLRVHLDVQAILQKVAQGIQEGIGFQSVLVSLYHEEESYFERVAQAGEDERWEQIRAVKPPAPDILKYMQDKHRVGSCYLVRHTENIVSPYSVLPMNPKPTSSMEEWHPEDLLLVPLVDKDDHLLGIISVDEPADGKVPSMEMLRALEVLANQTVHALESAQVHAQIKRQAVMDGLTGLFNHGYFQETLAARAKEHALVQRPYAVLMMDLDNFKEVNDTFGHLAGDTVLRAVAEALTGATRREDVAARYGGEEFALFLPGRTAEQASRIAERIRAAVDEIRAAAPGIAWPLRVTLSVGVAAYPENGQDHHAILEQADLALYRAKREGKNRVCLVG
jgi:diguanylate cyclase (GGDEF)-like protein